MVDEVGEAYLKARGFVVSEECPRNHPYVALCSTRDSMDEFQVAIHGNRGCQGHYDLLHPMIQEADALVDIVSGFVFDSRDKPEFSTPKGEAMVLFPADPAWTQVAETLAQKYPAKGDIK